LRWNNHLKDEVEWIETLALTLPLSYTRILAWPGSLGRRLAYMAQTVLECNKMLKRGRSILNGKCNADFRFRLKS